MKIVQSREEFLIELDTHLPRNCSGAEIGVLDGVFSDMILKVINPSLLVLIDPFETNDIKYGGALGGITTAYSTEQQFTTLTHRMSSQERVKIQRAYSHQAAKDFPPKSLDFIYLDGSHRYEDVTKDLRDWLPKLQEHGLVSGHDYLEMDGFGVIQAVDEFCNEYGFQMILFNEQGGDWCLQKKK